MRLCRSVWECQVLPTPPFWLLFLFHSKLETTTRHSRGPTGTPDCDKWPKVTMREVPQRLASPSEETPNKKKKVYQSLGTQS